MAQPIIQVEGLGKKYLVGHQSAERERYSTLRDVVARNVRGLWNKTRDIARGRQIVPGDTVEEFWALKDISFDVQPGEVVGIIGRNGAGKSTLLKILSRITEPTEGRVTLRGRVASLLEVGTGFHPELTGRENIYLNGAILGMTRLEIRQKFDEIVSFAGVEMFLDTPVKRYSSGMYVRLAFAVAAHLEPEVLIVDEVLAVGDAEFQKKCIGKMQSVATNEGRTVIFVSHDLQAVLQLTKYSILLNAGQLVHRGLTCETIGRYRSLGSSRGQEKAKYEEPVPASGHRVTTVRILTTHPSGVHISGENLEIDFTLSIEGAVDDLAFSFQIYDSGSVPMTLIWYQATDGSLPDHMLGPRQEGKHGIRCKLSRCRLFMGRYSVTTLLYSTKKQGFVHVLNNVAEFEVMMPPRLLASFTWQPGSCRFLSDATWQNSSA